MEKKKRLSLADRISQQNAVHTSEDERLNEQKIIASVSPDAIPGRSFADIVRASAKEYGHDKIMEKMRGIEAKAEANLARQKSEQLDTLAPEHLSTLTPGHLSTLTLLRIQNLTYL